MIKKIALYALLTFGWVYGSVYMFNHFNAWVGIGLFIIGLVIVADKIYKHFTNTNN